MHASIRRITQPQDDRLLLITAVLKDARRPERARHVDRLEIEMRV